MPEYLPDYMGEGIISNVPSTVIWNRQPAAGMAMTGSECTGCGKEGEPAPVRT